MAGWSMNRYQRQVSQLPAAVRAQYRVMEAGPGDEKQEVSAVGVDPSAGDVYWPLSVFSLNG